MMNDDDDDEEEEVKDDEAKVKCDITDNFSYMYYFKPPPIKQKWLHGTSVAVCFCLTDTTVVTALGLLL